jgi:hypothetical protein
MTDETYPGAGDWPPDFHGLGRIPSPFDPNDFPIAQLYALRGIEKPLALPADYTVPDVPPVLNQGSTPQCVAYSTSELKGQEDRIDQGQFFAFDQARFFGQIGGTVDGAVTRVAFDQMLHLGYPIVGSVDGAKDHKIAAYYAVPISAAEWQAAILAFGPIVIGMSWDAAFDNPPSSGILRKPSGVIRGGHAILVIGWTTIAGVLYFILQNSWGTAWGVAGRCYLAASYLAQVVGEAWKAVDVIENPPAPPAPPTPPRSAVNITPVIPPVRLLDSRSGLGLSGKFTAHVPRAVQIAGRGGIPAGAILIAGNLTVATAATKGNVSIGPDQVASPTTSTLNFKAGDELANGFIAALHSDGTLALVLGDGTTADLIVDVTAYFTP